MQKIKRLISTTLLVLYCTTTMPVSAINIDFLKNDEAKANVESQPEIKINDMTLEEYHSSELSQIPFGEISKELEKRAIAGTGIGDYTIEGIMIPDLTLDGKLAYCLDMEANFPVNLNYTNGGEYKDDKLSALLYHGYPINASNLKGKYGLTDLQARRYTQYAVWKYMGANLRDRKIPYVDELLSLANNKKVAPNEFNLSISSPKFSEYQGLQVSEVIKSSGSKGTFTFPSDENVYTVDVNGQWKNTFNIGDSFKIVAKGSVKGDIKRDIKVSIPRPTMQLFSPSLSGYQRFIVPNFNTAYYNTTRNIALKFNGIIEKGSVKVNKVDNHGNPLASVKFGVFNDSNAINKIAEGVTNANGQVTFGGLEVGKTYYVKELSGLEGYIVDTNVRKVELNSSLVDTTVTNVKIEGQIRVTKKETGISESKLQGAEFVILNSSNNEVDRLITNENGVAISKKLTFGVYKVKEVKAPNGYILDERAQEVKINDNGKIYDLVFENAPMKGSIEVKKIDGDNRKPLAGVKFAIFADENLSKKIAEGKTNNEGILVFNDLKINRKYFIKEVEGISGYVVDSSVKAIELKTEKEELTVVNNRVKGQIKVTKKETGLNDSRLQGAEFIILDSNNNEVEKIETNLDGIAISKKLDFGTYTIKEVKAPIGYVLNKDNKTVKIDTNNKVYELVFENDPIKGFIEILKIDGDTKKPLSGVKFGLYTSSGEKIEELITNDDGKVKSSSLRAGTYYIEEIEAKEGYVLDPSRHQIVISENNKTYEITIKNSKSHGNLIIEKVDSETKEPLAGVVFEIKAVKGLNKDMTWIYETNESGLIQLSGLYVGEYEIKELSPKEGYQSNANIEKATIRKNNDTEKVTITNEKIEGRFELLKYDESSEDKTPLCGVEFLVECIEGFAKGTEFNFVTGEDGKYISEYIPYGVYKITEVKTKEGYVLDSTPLQVEIKAQDELVIVSKGNRQIVGGLDFIKTDSEDENSTPIDGAVIQITGVEGLDYEDTFTSSKDGNRFSLPFGKYYLKEVSAPEGYVLSEEVVEFSIVEDGVIVPVELKNDKIKADVEIIKIASDNEELRLSGAEFNILNSDNEIIKTVITDDNGSAKVDSLPYGTYYLQETKAPNGYILDETITEFKVESTTKITITVKNNPIVTQLPDIMEEEEIEKEEIENIEIEIEEEVEIENENIVSLPDTSGVSPMITAIIGIVFIVIGGSIVFKRK